MDSPLDCWGPSNDFGTQENHSESDKGLWRSVFIHMVTRTWPWFQIPPLRSNSGRLYFLRRSTGLFTGWILHTARFPQPLEARFQHRYVDHYLIKLTTYIFKLQYTSTLYNKRPLYSYACPEQKWRSRTINKHFYMQKFIMHYGKASCHCCVCAQFHSHHSHFLKGSFSSF